MKALLLLPLLAVLVSGCVLPGGISIPGIPGFGTQISYENDVLIIKDFKAIPTTITKAETTNVIAYVENRGSKKVDTATVKLYDYCGGLFDIESGTCDGTSISDSECPLTNILPKETKAMEWKLKPKDIKLTTPCTIKISVSYPYKTDGLTSISFINQNEYQRQLELGLFQTRASDVVKGEGPIKAWFDVKMQQPIPAVQGYTPISLEIANVGSGFLATPNIPKDKVTVNLPDGMGIKSEECEFEGSGETHPEDDVKLIQNKRSLICQVEIPTDVPKDLTKQLRASLEYDYEFRAETQVTVQAL